MRVDKPSNNSEPVSTTQPEEVFGTPEALIAAPKLSVTKKHELLNQWSTDLEAKLRASDENMTTQEPDTKSSELLRRVKVAQRDLEKSSPNRR